MMTDCQKVSYLLSILFLLSLFSLRCCIGSNTISPTQSIRDGETIISSDEEFELGFFSPGNSSKRYVGLWHKKIIERKVVWIANGENPVADSSGVLTIGGDGNLVILDGRQSIIWSTNVSVASNRSQAVLLDTGNFVLTRSSNQSNYLWQSFDFPSNAFMAYMQMWMDVRNGVQHTITSWKSEDDPSPGNFRFVIAYPELPQIFVYNGSIKYWRSGEWNTSTFIGVPMKSLVYNGLVYKLENQRAEFSFAIRNNIQTMVYLDSLGSLYIMNWYQGENNWAGEWKSIQSQCDVYAHCGSFGSCHEFDSPICSCLRGFEPKYIEEWNKGNCSGGCVRKIALQCQGNNTTLNAGNGNGDKFYELRRMKLPDFSSQLSNQSAEECRVRCLQNCSCLAYAYADSPIGCLVWDRELLDVQKFSYGGQVLFLRLAPSELGTKKPLQTYIIVLIVGSVIFSVLACVLCIYRLKKRGKIVDGSRETAPLHGPKDEETEGDKLELPLYDFNTIAVATNNFSDKLGEGGFGPVYKGKLPDGTEVAVKRLSTNSGQGVVEFKNELRLISKLQHRNLVRLLGFCIDKDEKILLYEYMPHKSLDAFLFDSTNRKQLDWGTRLNIIDGIARGLLYLHRDSRLKVIHRDLKVSNILLDEEMNSKISDFGMARIFGGKQILGNTNRVVGTYGYMSPEYAMGGIFSEKSDVFSFGVLLLEIVSGMKNNSNVLLEQSSNLLGHAWKLWNEGKVLELMDPTLDTTYDFEEMMRCIHLGLLCVQEHAIDRPNMSTIVSMLGSDATLPTPKQPAFTIQRNYEHSDDPSHSSDVLSSSPITVTIIEGR